MTPTYTIRLKNGKNAKVPDGATIENWGIVLKAMMPCRCHCGDKHKYEAAVWYRADIEYAAVSKDGLMSVFIKSEVPA